MRGVINLLEHDTSRLGLHLIQDGAFAAMVVTELLGRKSVISEAEVLRNQKELLSYAEKENLIILTILSPKAALTKNVYPPNFPGYDTVRQNQMLFFQEYNDAALDVLTAYKFNLPQVVLVHIEENDFNGEDIIITHAKLLLHLLGLSVPHGD